MRRLAPVLLLLCLASPIPGQQQETRLRVDVRLVMMNAFVNGPDGQPVSNLSQENFRILEDGQEQTLGVFASGDAPVYVALVMDSSASTKEHLSQLKRAARSFLENFGPQDYVALYDVGPNAERVVRFTTRHEEVIRALDQLRTARDAPSSSRKPVPANALVVGGENSSTVLYDALAAIEREFPSEAQRRGVIAFTDSFDEGSTLNLHELSQRLFRGSATLYAVMPLRSELWERAKQAVVGSIYKPSTSPEQLAKTRPPSWVIQWDLSSHNFETIARLEKTSDVKAMVAEAMEEQGSRSSMLYLAGLPETNESVWMIQLDESGGRAEAILRLRQCATQLLRLLPSDARVWLIRYREKCARLLQPPPSPSTRASPPRPLTREEAQEALSQPDPQNPAPRERGKTFNLRASRVLILTDAQRSGVRELLGGGPPAWFAQNILVPENFPNREELDATLAVVVKSASEYLKLQFDAVERDLREIRGGFEELVTNTGGLVLEFRRPTDLRDSYEQIARQIKASYALGYYTHAGSGRHELSVGVTDPKLKARSRRLLVVEE